MLIFITIFIIIFSFIFGIISPEQCNKKSAEIKKSAENKEKNIYKKEIRREEPLSNQFKADGTPLKSILRIKPIIQSDKVNKTVSFDNLRTAKIGNRVKIEKTFNKNTIGKNI